ncbi:hypothetical protein EVAR_101618_1 [Eumeta japonica]|uniref:Uncharacterized protein n=1 Tax=Eumeta variegata TaxID=151549 RepID=A0A4C1T8V1_EUMVA|nr:hypothetical protein EVAR_101618_1 [Eumeta japonica]
MIRVKPERSDERLFYSDKFEAMRLEICKHGFVHKLMQTRRDGRAGAPVASMGAGRFAAAKSTAHAWMPDPNARIHLKYGNAPSVAPQTLTNIP